MSDVTITYKGGTVAELDNSGAKMLKTGGCYCEGDISVAYAARSRTYEITLQKSTGWTLLTELDEDVLAHINDAHLVVTMINFSAYEYDKSARRAMYAANTPIGFQGGKYPVYGAATWQGSETGATSQSIYYPPNKTDNTLGTGGVAAFRCTDGKYYVTGVDQALQAGVWRLTFTW